MIKMKTDDLIYEVKEEILCYEELGEEAANKWEAGFVKWLNNKQGKKKNVQEKNGEAYYLMEDESAVFDIADEYLEAVENNAVEEYWKKFQ